MFWEILNQVQKYLYLAFIYKIKKNSIYLNK
jgi:hypothetical protein